MTAKAKPRKRKPKPKKPSEEKPVPMRIVGELRGAFFDEHGEFAGEVFLANVDIPKSDFGKVKQLVDQAVRDAENGNA